MVALIAFGAYLAKRARLTGRAWAKPMLFRTWKQTGQKRPIYCPAPWVAAAVTRHMAPAMENPEPMMILVISSGSRHRFPYQR